MYRLGAIDPESGVKVHFVSNIDIAVEVSCDLQERYCEMVMNESDDNECMWDPGGMMMMNDEVFDFRLSDNITVICRAQHFDYFVSQIQKCEIRGEAIQYVKIHGRYFCICVSLKEFDQLKKLVCNAELAIKANESANKREEKISKLVESGHVVRAVKGEDGKLYKVAPAPPNNPDTPSKYLN